MNNNCFNRVNSKHGNINIDVDANGNIVLSQQWGDGKIILTSDEAGNLGRCILGKIKALNRSQVQNQPNSPSQAPPTTPTAVTPKAYTVDEKRKEQGRNAYARWTEQDDQKLKELYGQKKSIRELAEHFHRGKRAIQSRLSKLGLIKVI